MNPVKIYQHTKHATINSVCKESEMCVKYDIKFRKGKAEQSGHAVEGYTSCTADK